MHPRQPPPSLCPPRLLEPHSEQSAVPTDAGTLLGSGPGAEVVVWLLAVSMWHMALQVPQLVTAGQAGSAVSVGRMQLLQCGQGLLPQPSPAGCLAGGRGTAGVRVPQLGKGPAQLIPPPAQPRMSWWSPRGTQPAPIDPGRGAICSVVLRPCLPQPGLHGDVMFGSAPPVTA